MDVKRILLFVFCLVWAAPAQAASITLLKRPESSAEVTEALFRLQGELLAVGLQLQMAERPANFDAGSFDKQAWLERFVSETNTDAILSVVGSDVPVGVDIWICDRGSQPLRGHRVALEVDAMNPAETLAIRAIEVLRANLLVIDLGTGKPAAAPAAATLPARDSSPAPLHAPDRPLDLEAGAALLTSLDGVGPALLPLVRADWTFVGGLAAEATLSGFGTQPSVETEAGGVHVAQAYGLLGLRWLSSSESRLAALLALGAGALHTTLDGWAESPNRAHRLSQWALVVEGRFGTRLSLSQHYSLSLAGHVQFASPHVAVHFVDTQVATLGRPNLLASLSVGARQ